MKCVTLTFPRRHRSNSLLGQVIAAPCAAAKGGGVDQQGIGWIHLDVGDAGPRARTALPNVLVLLLEVFGNYVASKVPVEITPGRMDVVSVPVVEFDQVLLGLDPEVRNVSAG